MAKRYLLKKRCGCRVLTPGPGEVVTERSLRFCQHHYLANEMLLFLVNLAADRGTGTERWRTRIKSVLLGHEAELDVLRKLFHEQFRNQAGLRDRFIDAESALVTGERRLERDTMECRLCGAILQADDDVRMIHLQVDHRDEWHQLARW
jgi:hypothetical protein